MTMTKERSCKIGVTDWNLGPTDKGVYDANPDALRLAGRLGFDGVHVSIGMDVSKGTLPLADETLQRRFLDASKESGVAISSLRLDILQKDGLGAQDPEEYGRAKGWVAQSIPIAEALLENEGSNKVILLPFFGPTELKAPQQLANVVNALREIAPKAEAAGVVFALENTLNAKQNLEIIERIDSRSVGVYYDVGNAYKLQYPILEEIQELGEKGCMSQIHFKDNTSREMKITPQYLEGGRIDFLAVVDGLLATGYNDWVVLETMSPRESAELSMEENQKVIEEDLMTNRKYLQSLLASGGVTA